jgi:D-alanyl-D-alanine carboxypeptidase/D-alanyl-D-alanine-endopeptidase (penicillin-binding protein 4)
VSALAGVVPTRDRGLVWFAIINRGPQIGAFRQQQDKFLQRIVQLLQVAPNTPTALTPHSPNSLPDLGNTKRSEIVYGG